MVRLSLKFMYGQLMRSSPHSQRTGRTVIDLIQLSGGEEDVIVSGTLSDVTKINVYPVMCATNF